MAKIRVYRPDQQVPLPAPVALAERKRLPDTPVIGLVDNTKLNARELLAYLAEELDRRWLHGAEIELVRKANPGVVISRDDAVRMAVRAHLVITGLGD